MTQRSLIVLAGLTVASVVLALIALLNQDAVITSERTTVRAFPELLTRVNDVSEMSVTDNLGTTTVRRDSEAWVIVEMNGYPVATDRVRQVVLGLAETRLVEAKTSRPDRYARIEVEDVAPEARSRLVTLKDEKGETIVSTIVGKRNLRLFGPGRAGVYLRRSGEEQSWLTDGDVDLPKDVWGWVERNILNLPQDDVATVTLDRAGQKPVRLSKESADAETFTVADLPADKKADVDAVTRLAGSLTFVNMDDVKAVSEVSFPDNPDTARFTLFNGLEVTATFTTIDGTTWTRFDAAVLETGADTELAARLAEVIGKSTGGWVYNLSSFVNDRFSTRLEDLIASEEDDDGTSSGTPDLEAGGR